MHPISLVQEELEEIFISLGFNVADGPEIELDHYNFELLNIPKDYKWQTGSENVPVYPWQGHAIWGLTGRITRHLVRLVRQWEASDTRSDIRG